MPFNAERLNVSAILSSESVEDQEEKHSQLLFNHFWYQRKRVLAELSYLSLDKIFKIR